MYRLITYEYSYRMWIIPIIKFVRILTYVYVNSCFGFYTTTVQNKKSLQIRSFRSVFYTYLIKIRWYSNVNYFLISFLSFKHKIVLEQKADAYVFDISENLLQTGENKYIRN